MKFPKLSKVAWFDLTVIIVAIIVFILVRKPLGSMINPFIYALVAAYLLNPIVKMLEKRKIKRIWAILIIFATTAGVVGILFATFVPRLTKDMSVFISDIPRIFEFLKNFIEGLKAGEIPFIPEPIQEFLNIDKEIANISEYLRNALGGILNSLASSTGTLLDLVMTPLIAFYYLKDKDKLVKGMMRIVPDTLKNGISDLGKDVDKVLGGFLKGQLTVALFVGILTGIGCRIIGVPYSLTIGFVAGLTNIIPYFGPWLGGILPVVLSLLEKPIMALWVVILILVIQQIESSLISPQIMSHSVGLHPLTVMFSVLFFGSMMGIPGMIIGVPLSGVLKAIGTKVMKLRASLTEDGRKGVSI